MRALRLQNPAGVFGDLSAFVPLPPPRVLPATTSPTIEWKTAWAGDDQTPGPPAGHMRISVDGGPARDIPISAEWTEDVLNATLAEYGVDARIHVLTDEERAEQQFKADPPHEKQPVIPQPDAGVDAAAAVGEP